jgi:iron(III) transport system permease protein
MCSTPLTLGFVLPALLLARLVANSDTELINFTRIFAAASNSLIVAGFAASLVVLIALVIAYRERHANAEHEASAFKLRFSTFAQLGYAVPGAVLAIGVMLAVNTLDRSVASMWQGFTGTKPALWVAGTLVVLLFAYVVRFLGVALGSVESGLSRVTPSMDAAGRMLGYSSFERLRHIHFPLLRRSLVAAALLVFVDVMKELPATFALRPFNFDTLAVQVYNYASDERLAEAAACSLIIVLVGLIPIMFGASRLLNSSANTREKQ